MGEKAELTIKQEYGYGMMGSPPLIRGGATLIFDVELLGIADRRPTRWLMSDPELVRVAMHLKDQGNIKFREKAYKIAEGQYKDALAHADTVKNRAPELDKLTVTILQNMSVCTNNTEDWRETIVNCGKAIKIDPNAKKAYYLKSVAHTKVNEHDNAMTDIVAAIKLDPADTALRAQHETIKKEKASKNKKAKAGFAAFFSEGVYNDKDAPKQVKNFDKLPDFNPENPQTYFDITIGEDGEDGFERGRVVFELFPDAVPKTAENFRALCTGEKGSDLHYKGNCFHRIIGSFMMQGGDTTAGNGTGGMSIYGERFEDEQVWYPHTHKGVLSMANAGPNTNGSQFFICYGATPHLNGKHTIFGRVISGYDICEKAEAVEKGASDKPLRNVKIAECGELPPNDKLSAEQADFLASYSE